MSSDRSNLLAAFTPTGWSTVAAPPSRTASTKLGWGYVPSSLLKTEMQCEPHAGVAALAAPPSAALTPPRIASVATAASTFLFGDGTSVNEEDDPPSRGPEALVAHER